MKLRSIAILLLPCGVCGRAQNGNDVVDGITIDLGWVAAVQQSRGWLLIEAPPPPSIAKSKRNLKVGDVLLSIDGQDLAELGPLAVARMLSDVPVRTVPMRLERDGKTYDV